MFVGAVSHHRSQETAQSNDRNIKRGDLNIRERGVAGPRGDGFFRGMFLAAMIFAAAISAFAVGIATGSLSKALITGGILYGGACVVYTFLWATKIG